MLVSLAEIFSKRFFIIFWPTIILFGTVLTEHNNSTEQSSLINDFFDQLNARNHRPIGDPSGEESQHRPSISEPENPNVYYYSPKSYGKSSTTPTPSTPRNMETQQSSYVYLYPTSTAATNSGTQERTNTTVPVWSKTSKNHYYGNPATKVFQKFYDRDLSAMTAALTKHTATVSSTNNNNTPIDQDSNTDSNNHVSYDDDDEDDSAVVSDADDDAGSDSPSLASTYIHRKPKPKAAIFRLHSAPKFIRRYSSPSHGRSSSAAASSPSSATVVPYRLQTSHSHSMPHYYIPSTHLSSVSGYDDYTSGHHHHISLPEKSGTWLGSGLAAGILIGAIPFGIMMASMMPTLFTGAMPIVNTAAVGKRRRRRRSIEERNLFDQPLDKLATFVRHNLHKKIIGLLNDANNNYMAKNSYHTEQHQEDVPFKHRPNRPGSNPGPDSWPSKDDEIFKTVARYALAALDEPRCIKEMLCSLVADGRRSRTTTWQKTLYLLAKWAPKDLVNSIGLDGLVEAVRQNNCLSAYRCPVTVLDRTSQRKRSTIIQPPSSFIFNAKRMT